MKAVLKIEAIGDNIYQLMRRYKYILGSPHQSFWVAKIIGTDARYKYQRMFLSGNKDYRKSNSVGSRGVFLWYLLDSNNVYEVSAPISWKRTERYFCTVNQAGKIIKVNEDYVKAVLCLKNILE